MKKLILSTFVIFAASVFSSVFAQVMPAGASDSDLRDNNIRMRSNEIERVKRDADKTNTTEQSLMNPEIETKFSEIKEDFEGMQIAQTAIIKAYSTGQSIDYKLIQTSAGDINKKAKRLSSNLFASKLDKKDKSKDDTEQSKTLKEMIVELDNSIADFATSSMFQNLKSVDAEVAKKAQLDLAKVAKLSETISKEVKKMK